MNGEKKHSKQSSQQPRSILLNFSLKDLKAEHITENVKKFAQGVGITSNQIRKYYNEIMALKNKYETQQPDNDKLKLDMAVFLSKIEYGKNKAKSNERSGFENYLSNIEELIKQINDYSDFKNFIIVMEAIVAYYPKQN